MHFWRQEEDFDFIRFLAKMGQFAKKNTKNAKIGENGTGGKKFNRKCKKLVKR